jgi:hypothetical protein
MESESSDMDEARRVSERERASQSKPKSEHVPQCSKAHMITGPFPAGMEPMGIERHRRSPQGEREGASESIEAQARACTRVSKTYVTTDAFPAGIEPTSKV